MGLKTTRFECHSSGERVDVFLSANLPDLTRSAAQKLIDAGRVTLCAEGSGVRGQGSGDEDQGSGDGGFDDLIGGIVVRKSHRTTAGEVYNVIQDEPEDPAAAPQDIPIDIIYEDADVIVVNKPRGMVVHPAPGHPDGTLVNALLFHCGGSLSGIGGVRRPGIVHRIDKDTSGLVIAAKNDHAHLSLSAQLSARTLTREYDAIVCGVMKSDFGTVDAPIGRHQSDRKRQAVTDKNSRPAVTHYEVLARYNRYTHVKCSLETGRTHQIRVHLAHIGYPVLGDFVYGRKKQEFGLMGQCLHARVLKFIHPSSSEPMEISTELPGYFSDILAKLVTAAF